jgi:ligand-binding SRPBCC domain-containing protein
VILERVTFIRASLRDVFDFFSEPQNLGRITPAMGFRILDGPQRRLRADDRISYRLRIFGVVPVTWRTRITKWTDGVEFADQQERGPFRRWLHTHTFRERDGGVEMHDRVEYELPFGKVGKMVGGWLVRRELEKIFDYRGEAIRRIFN